MANHRRRRMARRSTGKLRIRLVPALIGFVVLGVFLYGIVAVNRQIKGYFTEGGHKRAVGEASAAPTPLPMTSALTSPAPEVSGPTPSMGPRVAVIIDDCGYSVDRCRRFLDLPIPITLSILPLTPHGKEIAADARAAGKSVMLHLPMEPESSLAHPGPGAITTEMSDGQVQAQVEADIDSLPDVPGANNHMGSKATGDPRVMRDVLQVFAKRHLFFIDSETGVSSDGASTARELGVPTAERDVFLDNFKDLPYIEGQLKQVEDVAKKRGTAIAIGHPNDSTVQALASAIAKMQADGITFVTAESLVK